MIHLYLSSLLLMLLDPHCFQHRAPVGRDWKIFSSSYLMKCLWSFYEVFSWYFSRLFDAKSQQGLLCVSLESEIASLSDKRKNSASRHPTELRRRWGELFRRYLEYTRLHWITMITFTTRLWFRVMHSTCQKSEMKSASTPDLKT